MAAPTAAEAQIIGLLSSLVKEIGKIQSSSARSSTTPYKEKKSLEEVAKNMEKLERTSNDLNKAMVKSQKEFVKTTSGVGKSLMEFAKDSIIPSRKIVREAVKDFSDTLKDVAKNQSGDYKKLAENTRDYLKANKLVTKNISGAVGAYRDYITTIKNISKTQGVVSAEGAANLKKFVDIIDDLKTDSKGQLNAMAYNVNMNLKQAQAFGKLKANMQLTAEELKNIEPVLKQVGKNFSVISQTSNNITDSFSKNHKTIMNELTNTLKSFAINLKTAVTAAVPQIFSDLMSQAKNAVRNSQYLDAGRLGVSQATLSDFIGQNRQALRTMGGGQATAPIANGQINQLQKQTHDYGLTGEDSLKFIGTTFDSMIRTGLAPSVENASKQMKTLYETMQITGMTFDELNSMVTDLSNNTAFLQLTKANNFQGQAEQIKILSKMLVTQGYTADYTKQLLELNKQAQYQGIEEAVKSMVGIQLLGGQVNRSLGTEAVSKDDIGLMQEATRGAAALIERFNAGKYDDFQYKGKNVKDQFATGQEFASFALTRQTELAKNVASAYATNAASDNRIGGLVGNTLLSNFGGLAGPAYQQQEAGLGAQARSMALQGGIFGTQASGDQLTGSKDDLVKNLSDINNAFIPLGRTTNELAASFKELLTGIKGNPAGLAGQGIMGAAGNAIQAYGLFKGLGALGGALGGTGVLGSLGGGISGLMSSASGMLSGAGAVAGTAAMGGAGALGAGAAGYGVGSIINKLGPRALQAMTGGYFGSDQDLSTVILDTIMSDPFKDTSRSMGNTPINQGLYKRDSGLIKPTDEPVTPDGSTVGEILTVNNDTLKEISNNQKKLLEATLQSHQENMDMKAKNSSDAKIQAALRDSQAAMFAN